MSTFQDSSGNTFQTQDNKTPSYGTVVTVNNGSGQTSNGWWNGSTVVSN